MTEIPMDCLRAGECATVGNIYHFPLEKRLLDIGMNCGSPVRCLAVSPLGDPVAYEICGAVIALRRCDAHHVAVKKVTHDAV